MLQILYQRQVNTLKSNNNDDDEHYLPFEELAYEDLFNYIRTPNKKVVLAAKLIFFASLHGIETVLDLATKKKHLRKTIRQNEAL